MKKKLLALSMVAICLSVVAYGTLAYYTASETAENVITSGNVGIDLLEWADEDKTVPYEEMYPDNEVTGVMPGTDVTKIVEVKNTGDNAVWVRVSVDKEIILSEESEIDADAGLMTMDFDRDNWIDGEDGYFYYVTPLEAGNTTEPLFAAVSFDGNMSNDYQNCKAKVDVKAYAVQTANNGTTVSEAAGWPLDE